MNKQTSLSILIPTKNRIEYVAHILNSIMKWEREDYEIIVHDNSDSNELFDKIQSKWKDSHKIKYFYVSEPISAMENFELAMEKASGSFVTMIGDDDGLVSQVMDAVDWMAKNNCDALLTNKALYTWPDLIHKFNSSYFHRKVLIPEINTSFQKKNAIKELEKCVINGADSLHDMPRLYYGIIKKTIMDSCKKEAGLYFPGPSPDMANAVSACLHINNFYKIDIPLFISGNSANSAAGMGARHEHEDALENVSFIPKNSPEVWEKLVPRFWSGPTVWAESTLKSLAANKSELTEKFGYENLYARALVFNRKHKKRIHSVIADYSNQTPRPRNVKLKIYMHVVKIWIKRAKALINKKFGAKEIDALENIDNIDHAITQLSKRLVKFEGIFK